MLCIGFLRGNEVVKVKPSLLAPGVVYEPESGPSLDIEFANALTAYFLASRK
jgi:hypothetical protein